MDNIKHILETLEYCISVNKIETIDNKDSIIWCNGSTKDPHISLDTLISMVSIVGDLVEEVNTLKEIIRVLGKTHPLTKDDTQKILEGSENLICTGNQYAIEKENIELKAKLDKFNDGVLISYNLFNFLNGSESLDGRWFDKEYDDLKPFWWREELKKAIKSNKQV